MIIEKETRTKIQISDWTIEIDLNSRIGLVIEYLEEKAPDKYSQIITELMITRYLPLVLKPAGEKYREIAIASAYKCQRRSMSIIAYAGLPEQVFKYCYGNENAASFNTSSTEAIPQSTEETLNFVLERIDNCKHTGVPQAVVSTLQDYCLPFTIPCDDEDLRAIAIDSAANCISWANEIREYARLPLLERVPKGIPT